MQRTLSFIVASMLFGASAWANPPAFAARATVHAAGETAGKTAGENLEPRAYLPITIGGGSRSADCPTISTNTYAVVPIEGGYYKDNRITDENPDFRLSILGYATVNELLDLVDYNGDADPNAPQLHGLFKPNRRPRFKAAYLNTISGIGMTARVPRRPMARAARSTTIRSSKSQCSRWRPLPASRSTSPSDSCRSIKAKLWPWCYMPTRMS